MEMIDFYYQIKGKGSHGWDWPPIFSGKVSAKDKKQAKVEIEKDYGVKFPLRVLRKDIEKENYLLNIREISSDDDRTKRLFELQECKRCEGGFKIIDKYNDSNEPNKGPEFCTQECANEYREQNKSALPSGSFDRNSSSIFIYKIKNIKTGMVYIGKTTQVFTLRWYQHFYHSGSCKFHQAIKESNPVDWEFSIVEQVSVPKGNDVDKFVSEREGFWISEFNSVENGYNSVFASKEQG